MAKFVLEIELGNDAMRTVEDVQYTINESLYTFRRSVFYSGDTAKLRDINDNTVGHWEVVD